MMVLSWSDHFDPMQVPKNELFLLAEAAPVPAELLGQTGAMWAQQSPVSAGNPKSLTPNHSSHVPIPPARTSGELATKSEGSGVVLKLKEPLNELFP